MEKKTRVKSILSNNTVSIEDAAEVFGISQDALRASVEASGGFISVAHASRLLNINENNLYAAALRYNKFPKAVSKLDKNRVINIFHKDFVYWYEFLYNGDGKREEKLQICKLNELKGQTFTIGEEEVICDGCDIKLNSINKKFCSRSHFVAYNKLTSHYSIMGQIQGKPKGRKGRKSQDLVSWLIRSKAARRRLGLE